MNTVGDLLVRLRGFGLSLEAAGDDGIRVAPRSKLTEEIRELIREHKTELLEALRAERAECVGCANLQMTAKVVRGTRRVFWWTCRRGHQVLEAAYGPERVLVAPAECRDFTPWGKGQP